MQMYKSQMASQKKNIIKRKGVPLNVVTFLSAKRTKLQQVKSSIRNENFNVQENVDLADATFDSHDECDVNSDQTMSSKRKLKTAERWEAVENLAINAVICSMGCPRQDCVACKAASGVVRCYNCGPSSFYCEVCAVEIHKYQLFHHFMEIWQVAKINAYILVMYSL